MMGGWRSKDIWRAGVPLSGPTLPPAAKIIDTTMETQSEMKQQRVVEVCEKGTMVAHLAMA